jgi:hypothetical protein
MLADRKEEQEVLFKEMMYRKMSVREAELTARKIAVERVRKVERMPDPEITELEEKLANTFGARVHIERSNTGGKIMIDFFSNEDLRSILDVVNNKGELGTNALLNRHIAKDETSIATDKVEVENVTLTDDRSAEEKVEDEQDLYSVDNFTV